jgi:shikimate kinase/shikimate 5-dehydrogenase
MTFKGSESFIEGGKDKLLLIGHRTAGKSTLGRLLARELHIPLIDIDDVIEANTGQTPAALVRIDETHFRHIEAETLIRALESVPKGIFATGGGMSRFPLGIPTVWIDRDGWEESASSERISLRPGWSLEREFEWMKKTRTPRYQAAAHWRLHLERGCGEEEALQRLLLIYHWLRASIGSSVLSNTWVVPRSQRSLGKCAEDAKLFGLSGVEIRSDLFSLCPSLPVPILASLRTNDYAFLEGAASAAAWDCDVQFAGKLNLSLIEPRPLILSVHAPDVFKQYFDALLRTKTEISTRFPRWAEYISLKYAPVIKSWPELRFAWQLCSSYERNGDSIHFLPQGKRWRWMRAVRMLSGSHLNYLSSGCASDSAGPPTLDYFLPLAVPPTPASLYAVIGDPVDHSMGDVFHRAVSLERDQDPIGYLKIPVRRNEIDFALHLLPTIGIRGLSVTSPLKAAVSHSNFVGCPPGLLAGNTLRFSDGYFSLSDTDEEGIGSALQLLQEKGISPGSVAIFGNGDVTHAVTRACLKAGWEPITRVSARAGWASITPMSTFQLIINASGSSDLAMTDAPQSRAWVDLHYSNITRVPENGAIWLNGSGIYKVQALAQRRIWGLD